MAADVPRRMFGAADVLPLVGVATLVVALDQVTKAAIQRLLAPHDSVTVIEGALNLVHARNPGAAFSLLAEAPDWFRGPFFVGMTVVAVAVLFGVISIVKAALGKPSHYPLNVKLIK